jgi:hypothetical protein
MKKKENGEGLEEDFAYQIFHSVEKVELKM